MFTEQRYSLLLGDSLIIYTDGLLEAHAPERILTPEALAGLASGLGDQPLATLLRALESAALGNSIEPVRDDIAMLAFSLVPSAIQRRDSAAKAAWRSHPQAPSGSSMAVENPQSTQQAAIAAR